MENLKIRHIKKYFKKVLEFSVPENRNGPFIEML